MAIFSSTSIIRATALFHLTTAYFLLVSPSTIAKYNLVVLFSQSFGMVGLPPDQPILRACRGASLTQQLSHTPLRPLPGRLLCPPSSLQCWPTMA